MSKRPGDHSNTGSNKKQKKANNNRGHGSQRRHIADSSSRRNLGKPNLGANGVPLGQSRSLASTNDQIDSKATQSFLERFIQDVKTGGLPIDGNVKAIHYASKLLEVLYTTSEPIEPGLPYDEALEKLPPETAKPAVTPAYKHIDILVSSLGILPPRPPLVVNKYSEVWMHKSHNAETNYEQLEFLGDRYIELIAARLITNRFPRLPAGEQVHLKELLVKNETLAKFAADYGFVDSLNLNPCQLKDMQDERGNKGLNKILGDVFEAYAAALVLGDEENGFAVLEKWLTQLWAPDLLKAANKPTNAIYTDREEGQVYNPAAKADLQRRIMGRDMLLLYEVDKPSIELRGDKLGQTKHFLALYLTGHGYDRLLLGKGEGGNRVEAGNWAAMEAMHGENKAIVEECERKLAEVKAKVKAEREVKEAAEGGRNGESGGGEGEEKTDAQEAALKTAKKEARKRAKLEQKAAKLAEAIP